MDATPTDGDAVAAHAEAELLFRAVDLDGARTFTAEVSRSAPVAAELELWSATTC